MKVRIVREESSCSRDEEKELQRSRYHELKVEYIKQLLQLDVMTIQCGRLTGKLHRSLFICPGIHQNCIEYEGKMISPRRFAIYAELGKQKDWKGSIRFQKKPLRFLFENNLMDFHEHDQLCTGKCIGKSQSNYWHYGIERGSNLTAQRDLTVSGTPCGPSMSSLSFPTVTRPNRVKKPTTTPITPVRIHNQLMNSFTQNPAMFWFEAEKTGVLTETIARLVDSISQLRNAQNPVSKSLLSKVTALFGLQLETVSLVYGQLFAAQNTFADLPGSSHLQYAMQIPSGPPFESVPGEEETTPSPQSSPNIKNPNEILAALAAGMIPSTSQDSTTDEQNVTEQPQPKYSPYF